MNNEELARLKARALKASPGPWSGDRYDGTVKYELRDANGKTVIRGDNGNSGEGGYGIENEEDEEYFLAASPDVVLALIERIEAMTVDAERLDWLDQNIFSTDMDRLDRQLHPNQWAWRTFAPENVQGSARNIISAAMAGEKK